MNTPARSLYITSLQARLPMTLIMLAVLGAAWFLLGIHNAIVAAIAALLIITWLAPQRYSNVIAGLGMIAFGTWFYFQFAGGNRTGLLTGLVGLVYLSLGIADLRRK